MTPEAGTIVAGFLIGLLGTWIMRKEQAYERAMLLLGLYIPLGALAFLQGSIWQWWLSGFSDAMAFNGILGWQTCQLGMLVNMCTRPPPKEPMHEDDLI